MSNANRKFEIVKQFLPGTLLEGLTYTERTDVAWTVGQTVRKPIGGSAYTIVSVREVK